MTYLPVDRMQSRVEIDKADSDAALFDSLMYFGEMTIKLAVSSMVAAVTDDRERHRYRQEYRLVRADGLGEWADVADEVLVGPAAQYLDPQAYQARQQLTQNCAAGSWQHLVVGVLSECLSGIGLTVEPLGNKVQARRFIRDFVRLRNETRGHGAPYLTTLSAICPGLQTAIETFAKEFDLFSRPWAYLYRNLSGKYRVTVWSKSSDLLESLKRTSDISLANGVYIHLQHLRRVNLVESTAEANDFWIANGNFNFRDHQLLSYVTNDRLRRTSQPFLAPANQLPASETQGIGILEAHGKG